MVGESADCFEVCPNQVTLSPGQSTEIDLHFYAPSTNHHASTHTTAHSSSTQPDSTSSHSPTHPLEARRDGRVNDEGVYEAVLSLIRSNGEVFRIKVVGKVVTKPEIEFNRSTIEWVKPSPTSTHSSTQPSSVTQMLQARNLGDACCLEVSECGCELDVKPEYML